MRFTIPIALGLAAVAVAAPTRDTSGLQKRCFPSCTATSPSPQLPTIGLAVQISVWASVDVPFVIANLQNMIATGDVRNADSAQQALLNLRAKIQAAVKLLDSETAKLAVSLVVRLDIANNGVVADDRDALIAIDATVKALAALRASIADGDYSQLAANIGAVISLRLQLDKFVPRTVGGTRSGCNARLADINVSAQLFAALPGPVIADLDTAVRSGSQSQTKSSFQNAAQLGTALNAGANVGGPYQQPTQNALVALNAGIKNSVNVLINLAKAAASGNDQAAINGSLALLGIASGYVDASLLAQINAAIAQVKAA